MTSGWRGAIPRRVDSERCVTSTGRCRSHERPVCSDDDAVDADAVRAAGIACFGPGAAAARIEGSKTFAKDVMAAAGVPTARSVTVDSPAHLDAALAGFAPPYVVKDDGLAAGKGVVVTGD